MQEWRELKKEWWKLSEKKKDIRYIVDKMRGICGDYYFVDYDAVESVIKEIKYKQDIIEEKIRIREESGLISCKEEDKCVSISRN